ncbi:MAG: DUF1934 domain-containing protein [Lachnospiraceae bacterium]|nr:DUF1934 domain-containing protein [Lachnospiraceae bacterium]
MNADVEMTGTRRTSGEDREEESIHFRQPGKIRSVAGRIHIMCDETDPEDGSISRYHMILTGDEACVRKKGPSETDLTFRAGETTKGMIRTPYGLIALDIRTGELSVTEKDGGVRALIAYELCDGDAVLSWNRLSIDVTEVR